MNPYNTCLKSFAIELETISKGIHSIAVAIYDMANAHASEEPVEAEPEQVKTETPPSSATEKPNPQGTNAIPANDEALEVSHKSEPGVDNTAISKQHGVKSELEKMKTETPQKKATEKIKTQTQTTKTNINVLSNELLMGF